MTNHLDQIAQWWETAEEGDAAPGDWIITRSTDGTNPAFIIERAPAYPLSRKRQPYRILARAPKPKPAWHDAVAVIAHTDVDRNRRVLTRTRGDEEGDFYWEDIYSAHETDDLRNPVPLIEARVTNETLRLALNAFYGAKYSSLSMYQVDQQEDMHHALHAALGLDPEGDA